MNKILKFRAWDFETRSMIYFDFQDIQKNTFSIRELASRNNWSNPIMQFTGLYDKKGVKIYDGDIVKGNSYNYFVVFENGSFVCYHTEEKDYESNNKKWGLLSRAFDSDLVNAGFEIEVIGNVYQNPELLK